MEQAKERQICQNPPRLSYTLNNPPGQTDTQKNSTYTFYAVRKATPVSISGTSGVIPSGNLTYSKSFGLCGVISSGSMITKVEAYINSSSGGVVWSYSATPNTTSYNIRYDGLNSSTQFKFGTLGKGSYRYVVYATNVAGRQKVIDSSYNDLIFPIYLYHQLYPQVISSREK